MEQRDKANLDLVRQWLEKAEKDLDVARHLAAERHSYCERPSPFTCSRPPKILKGFLVFHQVEFPKLTISARLLDLVATCDPALAVGLGDVTALNPYGVEYRYPGDFPDLTQEDADDAFRLAEKVWLAMKPILSPNPGGRPHGH